MNQDDFVLYTDSKCLSPYVFSVYVALVEKGIDPVIRKINLESKENYNKEYADVSLTRRVPTLSHHNFSVSESSAITEYLDELLPYPDYTPIYPKDVRSRARVRQVQAVLRSDFMPIRIERPTEVIFNEPIDKKLSRSAQESAEKLFAVSETLVTVNSANLFNDWCIADTDLSMMLMRLVKNGDMVPDQLKKYALYQWERASVQKWLQLRKLHC